MPKEKLIVSVLLSVDKRKKDRNKMRSQIQNLILKIYFQRLFLQAANPREPRPKSINVAGSGTAGYDFSTRSLLQVRVFWNVTEL